MDEKTLAALQGSIKKWEAIVAGEGFDNGSENCPLCAEFFERDGAHLCGGCPVRDVSGQTCCLGTPYQSWYEAHWEAGRYQPLRIHDDDTAIAAVLELEFLRSLLPVA